MKKFGAVLVILLLSLAMIFQAGCSSSGDSGKTETKTETQGETKTEGKAAEKAPQAKVMALGTHGVGSIVNAMGSGISSILSRELGAEVKTVASSGPAEWMPMMNTNEMDLGVLNNWDAEMGWKGGTGYDKISGGKGFPVMLITSGHKAANGVLVSEATGIKTVADMKGKRMVITMTGSPGQTQIIKASMANLGLTEKDIKPAASPSVDAGVRAVIEGKADINGCAQPGMGVVAELDAGKGARFISFDPSPEALKRMQDLFPAVLVPLKPGKGNTGIKEDPTYLMQYDFYLVGRESLEEDVVYNIIKALWDKNKELGAINKNLLDWTPENFVVDLFTVPYHPGAVKFYKEKGVWKDTHEKRQQELLAAKK